MNTFVKKNPMVITQQYWLYLKFCFPRIFHFMGNRVSKRSFSKQLLRPYCQLSKIVWFRDKRKIADTSTDSEIKLRIKFLWILGHQNFKQFDWFTKLLWNPGPWNAESKTKSCRQLCGTANVLIICYWIPQNCVDAVSVSTKLVEINQFCTFKDMSVESKGLHAQNCVCRNLACLCTVMFIVTTEPLNTLAMMVGRTVSSAPGKFWCAVLGPDPVQFAPMPFQDILNLCLLMVSHSEKGIKSHVLASVVRSTFGFRGTNMAPMDVLTSEADWISHRCWLKIF